MSERKYSKLEGKCEELELKLRMIEATKALLTEALEETRREMKKIKEKEEDMEEKGEGIQGKRVEEEGRSGPDFFKGVPEEVQEMILENLTETTDLVSCTRASTTFDRILGPTKKVWLFEKVFAHLKNSLEPKGILSCRQVCRAWKIPVDEFLESQPLFKELRFGSQQDMTEFANKIENDEVLANPFLSRIVVFNSPTRDLNIEDADYWETTVAQFVTRFGSHIKECRVDAGFFGCNQSDVLDYTRTIGACLGKLKNVKSLALYGVDIKRFVVKEEVMEIIEANLEANPLPELPQLTHLELRQSPSYFSKLVVSKYSQQLQSLALCEDDYYYVVMNSDIENDDIVKFPNLTRFSMMITSEWYDLSEILTLRSPHLKTVEIKLLSGMYGVADAIIALQQFGKTLQNVEISFIGGASNFSRNRSQGKLCYSSGCEHNIQSLKLKNCYEPLDYLLLLPSLQYLRLEFTHNFPEFLSVASIEEIVEISGLLNTVNQIYQSNIWVLLPSLKEFVVKSFRNPNSIWEEDYNRTTNREGYDRYHNAKCKLVEKKV